MTTQHLRWMEEGGALHGVSKRRRTAKCPVNAAKGMIAIGSTILNFVILQLFIEKV